MNLLLHPRYPGRLKTVVLMSMLMALSVATRPAAAQVQLALAEPSAAPLTLTLDEAIQIALVNNYAIRNNRLDVDNAQAQIREAWSDALPQIDANSSYTRNLKTANPFAGSEAGNIFSSLGYVGWLSFNEDARGDDDPVTVPITFGEYQERLFDGLDQAGVVQGSDNNPFGVENQFQNGISITQTLFSGSLFASIKGAERLKLAFQRGVDRQEQLLIDQVRQTFYQTLLAQEQAKVSVQSVARTRRTRNETARRVSQGVAPKFQRLSAEVQLANLETQLVQIQNQSASALDNLKFTLGIPIEQPVQLRGALEADDYNPYRTISVQDAFSLALARRPDLEQAQLNIELRQIDKDISRADYLPNLSTFANFSYSGNVPDSRTFTMPDPNDPFSFAVGENDFFSSSYWQPSINVGFSLRWNLFNGFRTKAQVQQRQIAVERAEIELTRLQQSMRLEIEMALRDLETAQQRILSQQQNVTNAELNYSYASTRLREGVATSLEERDASDQLDQSRLNYLQAVYDYLTARSAFETAMGVPLGQQTDLKLTSR